MSTYDIEKQILELRKYAELEGSELGELCQALCNLAECWPSYMADEFNLALENEIVEQLSNFREKCKIVPKTETNTITYDELEWNDWEEIR